ncbi:MAG: peptidylprolyl isomerase [Boseongicola sp.]
MSAALFPDLVVNGETIPHALVAAEAQNHSAPKGKPGIAWRKAANAVAVRTLLLQEAKRRRLLPEPAEVGPDRVETDEEALVRGLLEAAIAISKPTEREIHAEWQRAPSRFKTPPLWEVSHILCACDHRDGRAKSEAFDRAIKLTGLALENPRAFSRLAAEFSDCSSKSSGGALGQLGPGDTLPEFESALRHLNEGEITSKPILTQHGWHIIRMDAVANGTVLPFESVRPKISDAMEKAAWVREARSFIDKLVSSADISGAELGSISRGRQ